MAAHFDNFLARSQLNELLRTSISRSASESDSRARVLRQTLDIPVYAQHDPEPTELNDIEVEVIAPTVTTQPPTQSTSKAEEPQEHMNLENFISLRNSATPSDSEVLDKVPPFKRGLGFSLRQTRDFSPLKHSTSAHVQRSPSLISHSDAPVDEKKAFILKLTKALHIFGSPVHRTEYDMMYCCQALGVEGMFAIMPSMIIVSFGEADGDPTKSQTHILRVNQGLHCEKLLLAGELADHLACKKISVEQADDLLTEIIALKNRYNWKIKTICLGISSGCIAPLFFGGAQWELLACTIFGCIVGLLSRAAEHYAFMSRLFEALASLVISFLARLLKAYWYTDICFYSMMLSSMVWLLPGLSLTISITELATRNVVAGTARMFYCFIICIQIGFGIAIGSRLVFWEDELSTEQEVCASFPLWTNSIFFLGTALCFNILLDASPKQLLPMTIASAIGYGASYGLSFVFASDVNSAISAFCVGVFGGAYAYFFHHPPLITVIAGILMLVPGSIGVRGVTAFFGGDYVGGVAFGFNMIVIGLSISVGLFFSNMVVFPRRVLAPDALLF
eukprot:TRINITY_DN5724_c0_g1_i2.p1 TRINITY_DN5724_c0_g1~~TRINITY_DN5724_c0_g1_i2.p1  ORF type:complete len:563 (+),score=64.31 TRINITY_DN5724_c0_g1_i2:148-1836(+)